MVANFYSPSNVGASQRAVVYLALALVAASFSDTVVGRNSAPSSQRDVGSIAQEDVWIDAFNMSVCGKAKFRPWQQEQSAFGCVDQADSVNRNIETRIIGGEFALEGEFPSYVHINKSNEFDCGATLIDKNLVVTAAHCVEDHEARQLIFGSNWMNGAGGEIRQADRWCYPADFNLEEVLKDEMPHHDLAIIRFKQDIEYTDDISPACLRLDSLPSNETICAFAGLGRSEYSKKVVYPDLLKTLRVRRDCMEKSNDQSCYLTVEMGRNLTREGDSGSPVICYDQCGEDPDDQVKAFAVGANSWGNNSIISNPEGSFPEILVNHVADFHKLNQTFLDLLQAIRSEDTETTASVICVEPKSTDNTSDLNNTLDD